MKVNTQSGNALIIVLVGIIVIAVGALAYFSGKLNAGKAETTSVEEAIQSAQSPTSEEAAVPAEPEIVIEPGNPVVAKVNGQELTRVDVFNFIQTLPPQTRQQPVAQLFPFALEQVVNSVIVAEKVKNVNLDKDPKVKEQLAAAKAQIVRTVFLQNEVEKGLTEERLQEAYKVFADNQPEVEEAKAMHILVKEEALAKDLIKQIKDGGDFAELAKEHSTDGTAENGGDLGYFAKNEVVPEFAEATFALEAGAVTDKPVKSQFGYHVIKLEEKRQRPVPTLEQSKAFLEGQLRRALLDKIVTDWRAETKIERFDINGKTPEAPVEEETEEDEEGEEGE
ncbi:MAG: peptidylprolyl isomerase [Alphaproteobacteria bacterium]